MATLLQSNGRNDEERQEENAKGLYKHIASYNK